MAAPLRIGLSARLMYPDPSRSVLPTKTILGICRGCQLINVALGGSLYQDLGTQLRHSGHHRHEARYDDNYHDASILPGTRLAVLYGGASRAPLNSIHRQAIKSLGQGLVVEAHSEPDHFVEAIRWTGPSYLVGVQWHPEFIASDRTDLLDGAQLRAEFLAACERCRCKAESFTKPRAPAP